MDKHRLELFSDGVFAIILTILVLELKPPTLQGLAGVQQIAPMLTIHALAFAWIGLFWLFHYRIMEGVRTVTLRTQVANLSALFFITLIPFGAVVAAERPLEPLGASLMSLSGAGWCIASLAMNPLSLMTGESPGPKQREFIARQRRNPMIAGAVYAVISALCWITPWFGYAWMILALLMFVWALTKPHPVTVLDELAAVDALAEG